MKNKRAGFTLVELIVVLAVLLVLAAILIPTISGYIEDAKCAVVVANARTILSAAKATAVSEYVSNPDYAKGASRFGPNDNRGRVSSNMFYTVQNNKQIAAYESVDAAIAASILENLGSLDKNSARLKFTSNARPTNGQSLETYYKNTKQPGIVVYYMADGDIDYVELGMDGWLVHMNGDGTYVATKDGNFKLYENG